MKAMALRKPLVVADIPSLKEYLGDNNCIKYIPDNLYSLKESVTQAVLMDRAKLNNMLDSAYCFVSSFTRQRYLSELTEILKNY